MIAQFCHNALGMTHKQSAVTQLALLTVVLICTFVFTDFFVSLAIMLVWFAPLWFLYMYLFDGIYISLKFLNHAR